jgi:hypothetical protein
MQIGFEKLRSRFHASGFVFMVLKFCFFSQEVRITNKILYQLGTVAEG